MIEIRKAPMLIRTPRGWELPERQATDEALVRSGARGGRRGLIAGAAAVAAGLALAPAAARAQWSLFGGKASTPVQAQPRHDLQSVRDDRYKPGRAVTDEKDAESYNNYYEFSDDKDLADAAQAFVMEPWSVKLAGMVAKPRTIGLDDLMKQVSLQERVTRHRCVEAWAMTVPWVGFPLADLVKLAEPLGSAKYVVFTTAEEPKAMAGLHKSFYPWPYVDGVTMQEAMNDLAFLSVGMYGKTLPPQNGGPLRLTLPWKYGFKQVKAIVNVEFTDKKPLSFWENLNPSEYGFWANVNPAVPHPRWSQAHERLLGTNETVPTQIWNGYGEFVASMYDDKKNERLFA
jgi:sulfoxide reductase catalytic subunit YedY